MKKAKTPALKAENLGLRLVKRQGLLGSKTLAHWAFRNISFEVQRGEVFGVIGRNGAGKSSLLRVLARIFDPDEGELRSYGLKTCLLGLQTGFVSDLSGRENVILSGMLMGKTRAQMQRQLPEIEEFSELGPWLDQPLSTYSSGMTARLGFSVAASAQADIILIDEALSVGDQAFREKSRAKMHEILKSGRTVVMVSHNADAVEEMTGRAIWLEKGKVMMYGDSKEVSAAYQKFTEELKKAA